MDIMKIIDKVRQGDRFKNELVKEIKRDNSKSNSSEIKKTEARLNQLVKIASKLYEDYTADLINDRTYKDLLLKNKQEQDLLELKWKINDKDRILKLAREQLVTNKGNPIRLSAYFLRLGV